MTAEPGARQASRASTDEDLAWVHDPAILAWAGEHLPKLRRSVSERRTLRFSLVIGFLLKSWETKEPLELMADLLYTRSFQRRRCVRCNGRPTPSRRRCATRPELAVTRY
jgi:hypothetical protein